MRSRQSTWGQQLDGCDARMDLVRSYIAGGNTKKQAELEECKELKAYLERRMKELGKRRSSAFYPSSIA